MTNHPLIEQSAIYTLRRVSWDTVVAALGGGMANVPIEIDNPDPEPTLWIATHSMGDRSWSLCAQIPMPEPRYVPDPYFDGGWHVLTEACHLSEVTLVSASSGSRLTATNSSGSHGETWDITLDVSVLDGERYEGHYWRSFWGAAYRIAWSR